MNLQKASKPLFSRYSAAATKHTQGGYSFHVYSIIFHSTAPTDITFASCRIRPAAASPCLRRISVGLMFPAQTARSITAPAHHGCILLALSWSVSWRSAHAKPLLCGPGLDCLGRDELYKLCHLDKAPVSRVDGAAVEPRAPPYAVHPMHIKMSADKLVDPLRFPTMEPLSWFQPRHRTSSIHLLLIFLPKTSLANPSPKLQTYGHSESISTKYSASELSSKHSTGTETTVGCPGVRRPTCRFQLGRVHIACILGST